MNGDRLQDPKLMATDLNSFSDRVTPLSLIYWHLSQPAAPKPLAKAPEPAPPISLTHADVQDILNNKRSATVPELEWVLANWKQLRLKEKQRNEISLRATILASCRGRARNPNAELWTVLDVGETPVGLLHHRSWFERELRAGAQAIMSCRRHQTPRCQCWLPHRQRLWYVQDKFGSKSPEAWAATRLYEQFEEFEQASRQERNLGLVPSLPPIPS